MTNPAPGQLVRARWLARFGDEAALARRLAWDKRDAAWMEDAPALMLARMQRRAARGMAFLHRIAPAALACQGQAPHQQTVATLLRRATGWPPEALAPLSNHIAREADATGGGPVQAALGRTSLCAAIAAAREAAARLARDSARLCAAFGFDAERIRRVEAMGDPHAGGRRVLRLEDAAGVAVYLKPRRPDGEWLLARLAASLPGGGGLAPIGLVVCRSWFWMAEARPALHDGGVDEAGALIALADLAGAVDLHVENVRPTAEGAAVLDAEMVLHPDLPLDLISPLRRPAAQALRRSPLRTGLLPEPQRDAGLCGLSDWLPATGPDDALIERLQRGYADAFGRLAGASGLKALQTALGRRQGVVRLLARPTQGYATLLAALRDPARATDTTSAFLLLETLRIGMARHATRRPALWPLPAAEEAALLGGDIPRLWIAWHGRDIHEGQAGRTGATVRVSPGDQALARAARLTPTQRSARTAEIGRSLAT